MKLDKKHFSKRRESLLKAIGKQGILVLPSAAEKIRNRDCEYPFRQDSDFWYLTGFNEPEAVLVLVPGRKEGEVVLFCRRSDREMEIWNGRRAGQVGAVSEYGMDQAFPIDELGERMPDLLDKRKTVFHTAGLNKQFDTHFWGWVESLKSRERRGCVAPAHVEDRDRLIHAVRMVKSSAEQELMREACSITAKAHVRAMQICKPGMYEYQLEAAIHHEFADKGARYPAYTTIVGGGDNACILHYTENGDELKDGDLVLIDAGCELDHYAADITRTFPVNGKFSTEQKALYQVVLDAQLAAIDAIKPGQAWDSFHEAALAKLVDGLINLGLLKGKRSRLIADEAYKPFYMHGTGHWLGLDVHDVGHHRENGKPLPFEPGMTLTVEPGLYIASDNEDVDTKWRGIGIRIEDDVLVTESGCEVLTADVPKSIDEIEALMQAGKGH